MLEICSIASRSNGNCYYIGNSDSAILVDAGISRKQAFTRMEQKNINPNKIKAIFISHEHNDHFRGIRVLSKKTGAPVYMTSETFNNSWKPHRPFNVLFFNPGDIVAIDDLLVHTFIKNHDAVEPCSFRIEYEGINVGVFTDLGEACDNVINHFQQCNAIFLESNYDEDMLWSGPYPHYLKERIASKYGHLSNIQAKELLDKHHNPYLQLVILSHLSQENNTPDIAMATFNKFKDKFRIEFASRHEVGDIFTIKNRYSRVKNE
jgi:phosphoribosyl 1,2-cyclic phosphodiesterase